MPCQRDATMSRSPLSTAITLAATKSNSTSFYLSAEEQLRATSASDLAVLDVVRQATDALMWSLSRSEMAPSEEDPPAPSHYVGSALFILAVLGLRTTRAIVTLISSGYEPEALGLKRSLTEVHSRVKAIVEDSSGQHARDWLAGPSPSTTRKLIGKHADLSLFDLYSDSTHASFDATKQWLMQSTGEREATLVATPDRWPDLANVLLAECAREVRDLAVVLGSLRGLVPPKLSDLERAIDAAEARWVPEHDFTVETESPETVGAPFRPPLP
jgi:hypothetical protein